MIIGLHDAVMLLGNKGGQPHRSQLSPTTILQFTDGSSVNATTRGENFGQDFNMIQRMWVIHP